MTDSATPRLNSVLAVIPCLNEKEHIARLVEGLFADPGWPDPLVVVVDGGSTDGTVEIVAEMARGEPRIRLLHNPKRLQSAAVNLAARTFGSDHQWMVRVDAHARYPTTYVSDLVGEGERMGVQSVVVAVTTCGRDLFQKAVALAQNSRLGTGGSAHRVGRSEGFVEHGHHALFDIKTFIAAGGYDENFSHNEDAEFDARLRRIGGRIWLTCKVGSLYFPRSRPGPLFRQYLGYGSGRARTLLRHREWPRLRQILPTGVAPALGLALLAPLAPVAALPALVWTLICLTYGAGLAVSHRSAAGLLSGPAAMIMHAAWSIGFWRAVLARRSPAVAILTAGTGTVGAE